MPGRNRGSGGAARQRPYGGARSPAALPAERGGRDAATRRGQPAGTLRPGVSSGTQDRANDRRSGRCGRADDGSRQRSHPVPESGSPASGRVASEWKRGSTVTESLHDESSAHNWSGDSVARPFIYWQEPRAARPAPTWAERSCSKSVSRHKVGVLRRLVSNDPQGASLDRFTFTYRNVAVDPIGRVVRDSLSCATVVPTCSGSRPHRGVLSYSYGGSEMETEST